MSRAIQLCALLVLGTTCFYDGPCDPVDHIEICSDNDLCNLGFFEYCFPFGFFPDEGDGGVVVFPGSGSGGGAGDGGGGGGVEEDLPFCPFSIEIEPTERFGQNGVLLGPPEAYADFRIVSFGIEGAPASAYTAELDPITMAYLAIRNNTTSIISLIVGLVLEDPSGNRCAPAPVDFAIPGNPVPLPGIEDCSGTRCLRRDL